MELQSRDYEAYDVLPDFSIGNDGTSTAAVVAKTPSKPDTSFGSKIERPSSAIPEELFDEDFGDFAAKAIRTATE